MPKLERLEAYHQQWVEELIKQKSFSYLVVRPRKTFRGQHTLTSAHLEYLFKLYEYAEVEIITIYDGKIMVTIRKDLMK